MPSLEDFVLADLNGDGLMEVVTAGLGQIGVYPSAGGPPLSVLATASDFFEFIAAGDMDGDGDPDPVVATDNSLFWIDNDGGTLGSLHPINLADSSKLSQMDLGDVNLDGKVDVLVAHVGGPSDNVLGWIENQGGGTFGATHWLAANGNAGDQQLIDVDADGDLDVVTANSSDLQVFTNHLGHFTVASIGQSDAFPWHGALKVGFVDPDPVLDIVVYSAAIGFAHYPGLVGGGFGDEVVVAHGPVSADHLALGDLDGDGWAEFVSLNDGSGTTSIAKRLPSGQWRSLMVSGSTWSPRSAMFDADNDGDIDIALAGSGEVPLLWYEHRATGLTFPNPIDTPRLNTSFTSLTPIDLDGDGSLDLAASDDRGCMSWWRHTGRGFVYEGDDPGTDAIYPGAAVVSDFDGDGDDDFAIIEDQVNQIHVFDNDGTGLTVPTRLDRLSSFTLGLAGDFDGDGDDDFVIVGEYSVQWIENRAGIFGTPEVLTSIPTCIGGTEPSPMSMGTAPLTWCSRAFGAIRALVPEQRRRIGPQSSCSPPRTT